MQDTKGTEGMHEIKQDELDPIFKEFNLNTKQSLFVSHYLEQPGDPEAAAQAAGYVGKGESARKLLAQEKIRSAIAAATGNDIKALAPLVAQTFREILTSVDPSPQAMRIKLDAAKTVADRLGYVFDPSEKDPENQRKTKDASVLLEEIRKERQALLEAVKTPTE